MYCDLCGKEKNNTKSKHIKSDTHLLRKEYGIVLRKYEIIQSENNEADDILRDVRKDCCEIFFNTFDYSSMYIDKLTKMKFFQVIFEKKLWIYVFRTWIWWPDKKSEMHRKIDKNFSKISKVTRTLDSNSTNTKYCYFSKMPIPMLHLEFLRHRIQDIWKDIVQELISWTKSVENGFCLIKDFQQKKKHLKKSISRKRSVVQLVIYILNGFINITMKHNFET